MSFFSRLSDIITSNLNTLLEKAENPQATLQQVIAEMESGVESARRTAAAAMANAKRIKGELDQYCEKIRFWDAKAREAVALGRDDLARRALGRRRELADLATALEQQYDSAQSTVNQLKTTLRAVEARLAEALRRQLERYDSPTAASPGTDAPAEATSSSLASLTPEQRKARVQQLEQEMQRAEAEIVVASAAAHAEAHLEQAQRELDDRLDLESELSDLKREVAGS